MGVDTIMYEKLCYRLGRARTTYDFNAMACPLVTQFAKNQYCLRLVSSFARRLLPGRGPLGWGHGSSSVGKGRRTKNGCNLIVV